MSYTREIENKHKFNQETCLKSYIDMNTEETKYRDQKLMAIKQIIMTERKKKKHKTVFYKKTLNLKVMNIVSR